MRLSWCRLRCLLCGAGGFSAVSGVSQGRLPGHAARSFQILLEARLALPAKDLPQASSVSNSRGRTSQSMIPKASLRLQVSEP